MKIAYVATIDAYQNSGVINKITSQINSWNHLENEARLFIISKPPGIKNNIASAINLENSWVCYHSISNFITKVTGRKQNYLNKILSALSLKSELKKFNPDVIYYRFSIWFPGQISSFGDFPVIVELNTNDIDEFKLTNKLTQLIHLSTRKWLLTRANGFCSVTNEINELIAVRGIPSIVLGNGVDTSRLQHRLLPNNHRAQLVFVGSPGCRWHGIEKIISLAELLPQYDFHIVGPDKNEFIHNSENMTFHGFLEKKKLSLLYKKMDLAIGTLALHRKNMEEASPLKVREYIAYGLPVIVGYKDTDLYDKSVVLYIGNYENNVIDNVSNIVKFVEAWKNKKFNIDLNCIDMYQKEKKRVDYFRAFMN